MTLLPRSRRRAQGAVVLALAAALTLSACGGGSSGSAGDPATGLRLALPETINADPDVYFGLEGVMVTNSVYQGLVTNAPGSREIVPELAESWEISEDGLEYTFHLDPDATFADGSPVDAEAVIASFERRTEVAQSPSYMLFEVAGYAAPDDRTVVITLSTVVNNFLDRLASPWSPVVFNPALIAEHEQDGDLAQEWLKTNSAGSGPYVISAFQVDQQVTLTRNEEFWGEAPYFETVDFQVMPDPAAQRLAVEQGDLDATSALGAQALRSLASDDDLEIVRLQGADMVFWQVNTSVAPLDDPEFRRALVAATDVESIVSEVYGEYATVAEQITPAGRMPEDVGALNREYDAGALEALVAARPAARGTEIVLGIPSSDNGEFQRQADYMSEVLQAAGLTTSIQRLNLGEYFAALADPATAPGLILNAQPDDGSHPDNWFRNFYYSTGAIAFQGVGTPETDALIDQASATPPSQGVPYELYDEISRLLLEQAATIVIADKPTSWVLSPDLEGMTNNPSSSFALDIAALSRSGSE